MSRFVAILLGTALLCTAAQAQAAPIKFKGSDSGGRAAKVTFENVGNTLVAKLKNTSMSDVGVPNEVLTGVFFKVTGNPALTRVSGVLGATSNVVNGATPLDGVVGGEWALGEGLNQYGANMGISSSGLGLFGPSDRFPGANLYGPESPDGLQYGLTSAGDNPSTGNSAVTDTPLIKNEVIFTLGNWTFGDPTDYISNVTFQYGTALTEPSISGTRIVISQAPEPGVAVLLTVAGAALVRRRLAAARRKRQ
jgi:hypothetical protein